MNRSDIGVAEVSFRPSVSRLKMAFYTDHTEKAGGFSASEVCSSASFNLMVRYLRQLSILYVLLATIAGSASAAANGQWKVQWEPTKLVNGSPVLFRITAPGQ